MDDVESADEQLNLKMPEHLTKDEGDIEDYDDEEDVFGNMDEDGESDKDGLLNFDGMDKDDELVSAEDNGSAEDDVFAMARENKELTFANEELVDKIAQIEEGMLAEKSWQMKGEVAAKQREKNSLLEEYVDFDVASKLPPKVTQEMTNTIEEMIKQRILDEMFDDPVRLANLDVKEATETLNFNKSTQGLANIYGDEYIKKLNKLNPEVFASNDENAAVKKEIESLFTTVM